VPVFVGMLRSGWEDGRRVTDRRPLLAPLYSAAAYLRELIVLVAAKRLSFTIDDGTAEVYRNFFILNKDRLSNTIHISLLDY
jgi:hypothetical protein